MTRQNHSTYQCYTGVQTADLGSLLLMQIAFRTLAPALLRHSSGATALLILILLGVLQS